MSNPLPPNFNIARDIAADAPPALGCGRRSGWGARIIEIPLPDRC